MKRRLVLLGPPGCGKGTVAMELEKQLGMAHVSSGELLRSEVEQGTATGRQVRSFLERGELVPDAMVLELMEHWIEAELISSGFLLDGFPRTLVQARALDAWLDEHDAPIEAAICFECTEEVIIDRITGRRVCPSCGKAYHVRNIPPRVPGKCDVCGAVLVQRDDDTEEVVRRRLSVYGRQTEPLIEYYRGQGKLNLIDGTKDASHMVAATIAALNR